MNKQFEYKRITWPPIGSVALETAMNIQGADGWEAFFVEHTQQGWSILFKKEVQGTYTIPEEERSILTYVVVIDGTGIDVPFRYFSGWQSAMVIVTTEDPLVPIPLTQEQALDIVEKLKAINIPAYELEVLW